MEANGQIVIIGGGIIGLSIAVELKLKGAGVTVLSDDRRRAATNAAAGMLAPNAEGIPEGPLLELCLRSRWLYPEWAAKIENLTGMDTGYYPCGILAPVYNSPDLNRKNPRGTWLDGKAIHLYQPGLGKEVVGGWWYPEDGQVDNRKLFAALERAALNLGVDIREGVSVHAIQHKGNKAKSIYTSIGELTADTYVLATGSRANQLLPLPVYPVKGQMAAVRMPGTIEDLNRVLFGEGTYLVPRRDGRLIIGATSEEVGHLEGNTPAGLESLFKRAGKLYPALRDWPVEEIWWGFRPGSADEAPLLGRSDRDNLILAVGHYRNGILLAPITARLITDLILERTADRLLESFQCKRFSRPSTVTVYPAMSSAITIDNSPITATDTLTIAGKTFNSRLMTGTGKYPDLKTMQKSIIASGCEIVTVAVRRVQTNAPGHEGLAEAIDWSKIWMLPNTAGCQTAEEAVRVARLGREMAKLLGQEDNNFIKLEVIPDPKYLLPDPIGTLEAAEKLVKEGFAVLPYINADPLLAKRLEEVGCVTVMPLGSPIGSGQGIKNEANIAIIIESANIPVVVDAGLGTPSEAARAMEMGASALLINSAIALARDPVGMARAMGMATEAGRLAYIAGRMPLKNYASASSPQTGSITTAV